MKPNPGTLAGDGRTDHCTAAAAPLPRLSDYALIQIHDFIHHVLDLVEARYRDQIHRFMAGLCDQRVPQYAGADNRGRDRGRVRTRKDERVSVGSRVSG